MKKINFYFTAAILLLSSCNSSKHGAKIKNILPGTWQSAPIVIDGDSKDWPSPYPNYDAKALIAYATSNDRNNLYITMETGDIQTQVKILKKGLNILIDTNGHRDPQFTINYPQPNDNDPLDMVKEDNGMKKELTPHASGQWDKKISRAAGEATQYSLEGFGLCNGGYMTSQTSACGIKVRMSIDEYKELVVEAMVPFKAFYGKETISAADAGHPISVGFAIKGFKAPSAKNTDNNSSGNTSNMGGVGVNSGMGGRGGGRSGRNGNGPGSNGMEHLYESTHTWKHFVIAYK